MNLKGKLILIVPQNPNLFSEQDKELNSWVQEIKTKYIDNFSNETLKTNLPILLDKIMKKIEKLELNVTNYRNKINNIK